jgi:hypothetical protein
MKRRWFQKKAQKVLELFSLSFAAAAGTRRGHTCMHSERYLGIV